MSSPKSKMVASKRRVATTLLTPLAMQIYLCRVVRRMTVAAAAKYSGVDRKHILNMERTGLDNVSIKIVDRYFKAMGMTIMVVPIPLPSYAKVKDVAIETYYQTDSNKAMDVELDLERFFEDELP